MSNRSARAGDDDVTIAGPNVWEPVVTIMGTNCVLQGVEVRHLSRQEASGKSNSGLPQWTPASRAAAVVNQIGTKVLVYVSNPAASASASGKSTAAEGRAPPPPRSAMVTKVNADNTCNVSYDNGTSQKYVPLACLRADVDAQVCLLLSWLVPG